MEVHGKSVHDNNLVRERPEDLRGRSYAVIGIGEPGFLPLEVCADSARGPVVQNPRYVLACRTGLWSEGIPEKVKSGLAVASLWEIKVSAVAAEGIPEVHLLRERGGGVIVDCLHRMKVAPIPEMRKGGD